MGQTSSSCFSCCLTNDTVEPDVIQTSLNNKPLPQCKHIQTAQTHRPLTTKEQNDQRIKVKSKIAEKMKRDNSRPLSQVRSKQNPEINESPFVTQFVNMKTSVSSEKTREQFKQSNNYKDFVEGKRNLSFLIELGDQAWKASLPYQHEKIFRQALKQVYLQKNLYTEQNYKELELYIKLELINNYQQKKYLNSQQFAEGEKLFVDCLKIYEEIPESLIYEQKISIMNNFAVYYRKNGQIGKAIQKCSETLRLQSKYYTRFDQRFYFTLLNLACFYYENKNYQFGDKVTHDILGAQLPRSTQVYQMAKENQKYFRDRRPTQVSSIR